MPDAHSSSLHLGFATEGASVLGVLTDFNFLHHFPEGSTITGPVFAHDSDLLGAFGIAISVVMLEAWQNPRRHNTHPGPSLNLLATKTCRPQPVLPPFIMPEVGA